MKVEILMATYNGELYIREQLDSILAQTYSDWVLYVNDDGSADNTIPILEEYISKYPEKIKLSRNVSSRHGATGNFADLFSKVPDADWYVLCDQDDVWPIDRLKNMMNAADNMKDDSEKPLVIYGNAEVVDKNLKTISPSIEKSLHIKLYPETEQKQLILAGYIWGCSMMYNQALRKFANCIPKEALYHDVWLTILASYFGKIISISDKVVLYRQHGNNASVGVQPLLMNLVLRLHNAKGLLTRMRAYKNASMLQIEEFYHIYNEKMSVANKKILEECLEILHYRSRIRSLTAAVRKHYFSFCKKYYKYSIFLFLIKN